MQWGNLVATVLQHDTAMDLLMKHQKKDCLVTMMPADYKQVKLAEGAIICKASGGWILTEPCLSISGIHDK